MLNIPNKNYENIDTNKIIDFIVQTKVNYMLANGELNINDPDFTRIVFEICKEVTEQVNYLNENYENKPDLTNETSRLIF